MKLIVFRLLVFFICCQTFIFLTHASNRKFTYLYESGVLAKGQRELEVWTTVLNERFNYYRSIANRIEFEMGMGSNIQLAFYINVKQTAAFIEPIIIPPGFISVGFISRSTSFGFSTELKYKISDPVAHPLGSALYFEFTLQPLETELEFKLILDKQIGKHLHVINGVFEPEWEKSSINGQLITERKNTLEFLYGYSYSINKNWNIGFEIKSLFVYEQFENFRYSSIFAGPGVSYVKDRIWINFTVLPQISKLKHADPTYSNPLILDNLEKIELRLLFSFIL